MVDEADAKEGQEDEEGREQGDGSNIKTSIVVGRVHGEVLREEACTVLNGTIALEKRVTRLFKGVGWDSPCTFRPL